MKVKILVKERMKKMEKELKFLKERLNQQAVQSLRDEPVRRKVHGRWGGGGGGGQRNSCRKWGISDNSKTIKDGEATPHKLDLKSHLILCPFLKWRIVGIFQLHGCRKRDKSPCVQCTCRDSRYFLSQLSNLENPD